MRANWTKHSPDYYTDWRNGLALRRQEDGGWMIEYLPEEPIVVVVGYNIAGVKRIAKGYA